MSTIRHYTMKDLHDLLNGPGRGDTAVICIIETTDNIVNELEAILSTDDFELAKNQLMIFIQNRKDFLEESETLFTEAFKFKNYPPKIK